MRQPGGQRLEQPGSGRRIGGRAEPDEGFARDVERHRAGERRGEKRREEKAEAAQATGRGGAGVIPPGRRPPAARNWRTSPARKNARRSGRR